MLIDIKKEFASLGNNWEAYIQFLEIKSFVEASNCLREMENKYIKYFNVYRSSMYC